jgi:hypothetical protein
VNSFWFKKSAVPPSHTPFHPQPSKQKRKFSSFFKSLVIELDKELYGPDNHLVEVSVALTPGSNKLPEDTKHRLMCWLGGVMVLIPPPLVISSPPSFLTVAPDAHHPGDRWLPGKTTWRPQCQVYPPAYAGSSGDRCPGVMSGTTGTCQGRGAGFYKPFLSLPCSSVLFCFTRIPPDSPCQSLASPV